MTLFTFTGFANYTNRTVKKYDELGYYVLNSSRVNQFDNINFVIADGVSTSQVVNLPAGTSLPYSPDYLVVCDGSEGDWTIKSRWYIVEALETRALQYKLTLRRDLIADNYDNVMNAPSRINRGWCETTNSAIYNSENIMMNQIKRREYLIKDKTNTPWIVGYLTDSAEESEITNIDGVVDMDTAIDEDDIIRWLKTKQIVYEPYGKVNVALGINAPNGFYIFTDTSSYATLLSDSPEITSPILDYPRTTDEKLFLGNVVRDLYTSMGVEAEYERIMLQMETYFWGDVSSYNGKVFKDSSNNYYRIKMEPLNYVGSSAHLFSIYSDVHFIDSILGAAKERLPGLIIHPANQTNQRMSRLVRDYSISIEKINKYNVRMDFPAKRKRLNNQPYSMFAMPLESIEYKYKKNSTIYTNFSSKAISLALASGFAAQFGSRLVDLQLLPFCPVQSLYEDDMIDLTKLERNDDIVPYNLIYEKNNPANVLGFAVWCFEDSGSFNIESPLVVPSTDPIEFKVSSCKNMYRLCSPNYSSQWEFSPSKNGGLTYWRVDYTYKPYSPYIRVAPVFGDLYGGDFSDVRGLICSGDYSLSQTSEPWSNYQIAHKNYDLQFNREIESLEYNRNMGLLSNSIGVTGSAVSTIATGNALGLLGIGSQVSNTIMNYKSAENNIEDKKYLHNLEMGNIKAQPSTITKVGAQDISNKMFPILEWYSCTDEEADSIRSYLDNFSFTINRQGNIKDYMKELGRTWIEADLITVPNFKGDAHELMELKNELMKGVYIYNG